MSTLRKKKTPNSIDPNAVPWPNLPQRLIKHIATHPNTLQNLNFGLATKSWRSEPKTRHVADHKQPWTLVETRPQNNKPLQFCGIEFPRDYWSYWCERNRPRSLTARYPWNHFEGCSHGILLARDCDCSSKLFLFHPWHQWHREIPPWDDSMPFNCAALSSNKCTYFPRTTCVVAIATGASSPAFLFYKLEGDRRREWIKQDCAAVEPNNGALMRFTNILGLEGKFYALSSQGTLAVIEPVVRDEDHSDYRFEIAIYGKTRAVPSVPFRGFKECLIESNDEILLALLVNGKALNVVDHVEVYRLRLEGFSWRKMESLGVRSLFVGKDCCVSVCAEEVGCRANCVFFTQPNNVGVWFEFDVKFGIISRAWTGRNNSSTGNPLEWDHPVTIKEDLVK